MAVGVRQLAIAPIARRGTRSRLLRVATAFCLAVGLTLPPSVTSAAEFRLYGGLVGPGTNGAQGIDGYIRHSGAVLPNCPQQFLAAWLGVGDPSKWVQIGQTQGLVGGSCGSSSTKLYAEQMDCNFAKYAKWDLGEPPTPNYPVYVNRTGNTAIDPCTQGTDRQYAFRIGSFTSAPKQYSWINNLPGRPEAELEMKWQTGVSRPPMGTDRFGLNHNFQVQSGYGLKIYKNGSWLAWNPTNVPNTSSHGDGALVYVNKATWYAFEIHD